MAKRAADSFRMDVRDLMSFATVFVICLVLFCIYWFIRFLMRERVHRKKVLDHPGSVLARTIPSPAAARGVPSIPYHGSPLPM